MCTVFWAINTIDMDYLNSLFSMLPSGIYHRLLINISFHAFFHEITTSGGFKNVFALVESMIMIGLLELESRTLETDQSGTISEIHSSST